ncbi:MAG: phosphatase PAP2 family protein [Devosia sp.]
MLDLSKPWPLDLTWKGWTVFALGFVVLLTIVYWVDVPLSLWAQSWPQPIRDFFFAITDLGLSDWYLIPSLALFLVSGLFAVLIPKPTPKRALWQMTGLWAYLFVGVGLPGLLSNLVKRAIGRGRPELFDQYGPLSFQNFFNDWTYQSFPSGHATTAFALCFVVGFLSPRRLPWLLVFAIVISLSRIVVGAHYPTDALGGALVGTLGAYAVRNFFASRGWVFQRLPDGRIDMRELTAVKRLLRRRG